MGSIKRWYADNQDQATWFLLGLLFSNCLTNLDKGDYIWAAADAVLFYVNYKLRNVRLS